jgi:hypothetical protein
MKTWIYTALCLLVTLSTPMPSHADPMEELLDSFRQQYGSLTPRPGSSVNSDYVFRQTALGVYYTTNALAMIHDQNAEMLQTQHALLERLDRLLRQNQEMLQLLRGLQPKPAPAGTDK